MLTIRANPVCLKNNKEQTPKRHACATPGPTIKQNKPSQARKRYTGKTKTQMEWSGTSAQEKQSKRAERGARTHTQASKTANKQARRATTNQTTQTNTQQQNNQQTGKEQEKHKRTTKNNNQETPKRANQNDKARGGKPCGQLL